MAMIKKENWKQRVERAKLQLGELIDLDQDPPVRYTAIKCETALLVLEELNKLHISEMKKLLERVEAIIWSFSKYEISGNNGKYIDEELLKKVIQSLNKLKEEK
jgi:hypothetical protein